MVMILFNSNIPPRSGLLSRTMCIRWDMAPPKIMTGDIYLLLMALPPVVQCHGLILSMTPDFKVVRGVPLEIMKSIYL